MKLSAYDIIIEKLNNATESLSPERQKKLAQLLADFRVQHDTVLWEDSAIAIAAKIPAKYDYRPFKNGDRKQIENEISQRATPEEKEKLPWE